MADSDEQIEFCGKCGQAKRGSGRLTQWIKVCSCFAVPETPTVSTSTNELKLCSICGKRINAGRAGSFTQWVFRSDACSCPRPESDSQDDTTNGDNCFESADSTEQPKTNEAELERQKLAELYSERIPADRYQVIREIGKGAAGTVVLCRDLLLQKKVAIKSLNFLRRESLLSFQQEAKATSKLNHPNIVQVIDFGTTVTGAPYMVLEYFDGFSLESSLSQYGAMPVDLALDVFKQVLNALIYSHAQKIWHRDIKPSNILLANVDGETIDVRLIDFGIAAFTQTIGDTSNEQPDDQHKTLVGTPAYMSPDQALGRSYDARSEIYSLGCVLFEMLTGRPPFLGDTALETISLHGNAVPPKLADTIGDTSVIHPTVLAGLETVIETCLAKDPKNRFHSVAQLKQALPQFNNELSDRRESLITGMELNSQDENTENVRLKKDNNAFLMIALAAVCILPLIMFIPYLLKDASHEDLPKMKLMSNTDEGTDQGQGADLTVTVGKHFWHAYVDANSSRILKNIKRCNKLENLWLSTVIDDKLIDYVSGLKLEGLAFDDSTFVDMPSAIDKITKMDSLNLLVFLQSNLTDKSLEQISTMPKLHFLAVGSDLVTDSGIRRLQAIPELNGVSFSGMKQVTDKTIDAILPMQKLIALSVGETNITADGAIRLIKSGRYIAMSLGGIPLTEPFLDALKKSKIERLALMHSRVNQHTLDCLSAMKKLRTCDLRCCPEVDAQYVARLNEKRREAGLPRVRVLWGQDNAAHDWDVMIGD